MKNHFDTSPAHRLAYLVMRKCGCSSIKYALSKIRDSETVELVASQIHSRHENLLTAEELGDESTWYKFTLVRDPVKRFLSFYANKILDQNLRHNHTFQNTERYGLFPNMSMDQVIDRLTDDRFIVEPHIVPQAWLLDQLGFSLDHVGRLENMAATLAAIAKDTGVQLPVQHLNQESQKPVAPTREQFDRLTEFYREDIARFGYPSDYDEWHSINVEGREHKYQLEPGYTFENQAKLVSKVVESHAGHFEIHLRWRVMERMTHRRVIRLLFRVESKVEVFDHLPPLENLASLADANGFVDETIVVPHENIPVGVRPEDLFFEVYFTHEDHKRAPVVDYMGHNNMVLFGFGHLPHGQVPAKDASHPH